MRVANITEWQGLLLWLCNVLNPDASGRARTRHRAPASWLPTSHKTKTKDRPPKGFLQPFLRFLLLQLRRSFTIPEHVVFLRAFLPNQNSYRR
jgi:hypothetical protein